MKKKYYLYVLACSLALPLVACGKDKTPEEPSTFSVNIDRRFGHVEISGKQKGIKAGENVNLKITAIDGFNLVSEKLKVNEERNGNKNVDYTWTASTSNLFFKMPECNVVLSGYVQDPQYDIVFDKYTPLDGGDVEVNGVKFHFDENLVNENCDKGFIELAPYGSLYLESYLPGITEVFVKEIYDGEPDGGFNLGKAATPNTIEGRVWYSQTTERVILSPDTPYFVINNREKTNVIEYVKLKYTPCDPEKDLKELIKVSDFTGVFDPSDFYRPYDDPNHKIDTSKIPDNRIVKPIEPLEYNEPGEYIFGYEVYSKTEGGDPAKLLYTSKAKATIKGGTNNKHWGIFHLKDKTAFIKVQNNQKVDISLNTDVAKYNWNNAFNDLATPLTSDRHFYPTYSVIGLPSLKNGDGCYSVSQSYNAFDKHLDMPNPIMKPGYVFGGWFYDFECTKPFNPDAEHVGDFNLYAKCMESDKSYRKVYYYDYDGTFLNRVDYLEENDNAELTLPTFDEIGTTLPADGEYITRMYELRMGANRIKMLRPQGMYPVVEEEYEGDKLKYSDLQLGENKYYDGDIKLIVSRAQVYMASVSSFTLFFEDTNHNFVASGFTMNEVDNKEDRILVGRYLDWNEDWSFDYTTFYDPNRCDEFTVTDAIEGYIVDQGSYTSIATYGYGNKYIEHSKPLEGIIRHDSVTKVNRRAFFNRFGLKGTYFPRNAREFAMESYANTDFNGNLLLPKNLDKIGARAFLGSTNIKVVCLPRSLTSVGKGAFSLASYNEAKFEFENIHYRADEEKIEFYYEGSEQDFKKLDDTTKNEILNNASIIHYGVSYTPYYGR